MIIYDEMKSPTLLKLWWEKMSQDVANSYPIVDFSLIDNKFKMNTCVDIGCNVGAFSLVASERFKSVVSFEPGYFTSIIARTKLNQQEGKKNIVVYNLAVGKNTGDIVKLRCDTNDGERNSGNATTTYDTDSEEYELITTVSLEKVFELCETDFIDYLKIDCEGAEYDILLDKDLSNIGIICGEIHGHPILGFDVARKKLLNYMSANFNISASRHNFFAVNKKYNIDPTKFYYGDLYEAQPLQNR